MTTKRPSLFSDIPGKWRGRTLRRGCESNSLTIIITIPQIVVVLTLTHRYLVNAVRGRKTGSNTLEWITSGGKTHTHTQKIHTRIIYVFFSHPTYYLRTSFLSLLVVTQIGGHITGSFPPSPRYGSYVTFLSREDFSHFFPRRPASNCALPTCETPIPQSECRNVCTYIL